MFVLQKMVEKNETFVEYKFKEKVLESIRQLAGQHGRGTTRESNWWRAQVNMRIFLE